MMIAARAGVRVVLLSIGLLAAIAAGQDGPPPGGGPMGGGFGPPGGADRKLVKEYDKNKNGRLEGDERKAARAFIKADRAKQPARGGPPRMRENREPAKPGIAIKPADVKPVAESVSFYEPSVLRTLFFEFEARDWEDELADFMNTDVEVPATLVVDGRKYPNVGVSFRGASSLFTVGAGYKRSLNVSIDAADEAQRLLGYKTLNLLNAHADPSFLHTVLVSRIARAWLPAPKANWVRVVINGENWGIYPNVQQYDRIMLQENFESADGARWKVPGSPQGRGGLEFFGDDVAEYKRRFEIKGGDDKKSWAALVELCRVLNETPLDQLEAKLAPILDLENVLRFLAVDIVVANDDGYWTRASDYSIFLDTKGRFHLMPHDMNEAFGGGGMGGPGGPPGGGGRRGRRDPGDGPAPGDGPPPGPGGDANPRPPMSGRGPMMRGGPTLDPLIGLDDARKPLRSRLLNVPALRERYLRLVREVATKSLDWASLGPFVAQSRALLDREIEIDTRKLSALDAFRRMTADEATPSPAAPAPGERSGPLSLRAFADQRRKFLLDHEAIKALDGKQGAGGGR